MEKKAEKVYGEDASLGLNTSYNTIMVFLKEPWRLSLSIVSLVITLMVAPRSIKICGTIVPLMWTSTIGLPGSRYFG